MGWVHAVQAIVRRGGRRACRHMGFRCALIAAPPLPNCVAVATVRAATSPTSSAGGTQLVAANPDGGQILQTRAWGEFKRAHRWSPRYLVSETDPAIAVLELRHTVPGLGVLGYVPKGPGVSAIAQLPMVLDGLRATAGSAFAIKVEPEIEQTDAATSALRDMGLEKSRHDVQISRATIIVDLRPDEDAILASFKPKCRYNIRLAQRRGVVVEPVPLDGASIDTMYVADGVDARSSRLHVAQQGVLRRLLAAARGRGTGTALLRVAGRRGARRSVRHVHRQQGLVQGRRIHEGARSGDGAAPAPVGGDALAQVARCRSL